MLIPATSAVTANSGVKAAGADAQLIPLNSERNGLLVQVDTGGTGTVYLKWRSGAASAADFDYSLAPGQAWNGKVSDVVWTGAVRFFSAGTPNVAVVEV